MKNLKALTAFAIILISLGISSCSVVGGIFKAGMDFGIFMVILVVVIIAFIVFRLRRK